MGSFCRRTASRDRRDHLRCRRRFGRSEAAGKESRSRMRRCLTLHWKNHQRDPPCIRASRCMPLPHTPERKESLSTSMSTSLGSNIDARLSSVSDHDGLKRPISILRSSAESGILSRRSKWNVRSSTMSSSASGHNPRPAAADSSDLPPFAPAEFRWTCAPPGELLVMKEAVVK